MGAANNSIPAGGDKPSTKEPGKGQKQSTIRQATQPQEMANPDKDTKETTPTEPHRIPTMEFHPTKKASKAKHHETQKQIKRVT